MPHPKPGSRRLIATYTGPRAFAPHVRRALEQLGYMLTSAERVEQERTIPDLRIVDERRLSEVPSIEDDPDTAILLLTGARPGDHEDARIAGRVHRPADLVGVYRVIQIALEPTPRQAPRVNTRLPARCVHSDHRWVGSVRSLSESGCLFRTPEEVNAGTRLNLQFALPDAGIIDARAECVYRTGSNVGLAFDNSSMKARATIGDYVTRCLTGST